MDATQSQDAYIEYRVESHDRSSGKLMGEVWYRYSEFADFSHKLQAFGLDPLNLPPTWRLPGCRHGLHGTKIDLEKRRKALEQMLQAYSQKWKNPPQILSTWLGTLALAQDSAHSNDDDLPNIWSWIGSGSRCRTDYFAELADTIDEQSAHLPHAVVQPIVQCHQKPMKQSLSPTESCLELKLCIAFVVIIVLIMLCLSYLQVVVFSATYERTQAVPTPSSMVFLRGALFGSLVTLLLWLASVYRRLASAEIASGLLVQHVDESACIQIAETPKKLSLLDFRSCDCAGESLASTAISSPCSSPRSSTPSVATSEVGSLRVKDVPAKLSLAMEASVEQWIDTMMLNARSDVNFQGHPWQHKSSSKGVDIFCSDISGSNRKVWKSRCTILLRGCGSDLRRHILHWPYRLAWDPSFSGGETIFTSGPYDLVSSRSHASGPVSAREFVDIRSGKDLPDGSIVGVSVGVNSSQVPGWPYPDLKKGVLRAEVQPGSGFLCTPLPPFPADSDEARKGQTAWRVEMVGNVDLKGWLSTRIINLAMTSAMTNTCVGMMNYFASTDCREV